MLKLKKPRPALRRFFSPLRPLGRKMGPVLFQLPPRWDLNLERLRDFLDALPKNLRFAFELRDPRWMVEATLALFRERGIAFCIYDFDGRQSPRHITAEFSYIRLHGPGARYQGSYQPDQLKEWATWISGQRERSIDVYCYFDNDQNAYAPQNAAALAELLKD
jgi:uncharacterized protein YecE (DUF72 family)